LNGEASDGEPAFPRAITLLIRAAAGKSPHADGSARHPAALI
jgi:hypothetical protein